MFKLSDAVLPIIHRRTCKDLIVVLWATQNLVLASFVPKKTTVIRWLAAAVFCSSYPSLLCVQHRADTESLTVFILYQWFDLHFPNFNNHSSSRYVPRFSSSECFTYFRRFRQWPLAKQVFSSMYRPSKFIKMQASPNRRSLTLFSHRQKLSQKEPFPDS